MKITTQIPHKKERTIILILILLIYASSTIYLAIKREDNNIAGQQTKSANAKDSVYDDKYYGDDNAKEDDFKEYYIGPQEVDIDSYNVRYIYEYIKEIPYITDIKSSFKTSELTSEEKMKLVAASLNSKNVKLYTPHIIKENELILNNKKYLITTPNTMYNEFEVSMIYKTLFGTLENYNKKALMYSGENIVYKYNKENDGYIKYEIPSASSSVQKPLVTLTRAIEDGKKLQLHIKVGTITEIYKFELEENYYTYKLVERVSSTKNNSI